MGIPVLLIVDLGDVLDVDADVHDGQRLVGKVELGVVARDADRLALGAHAAAVSSDVEWEKINVGGLFSFPFLDGNKYPYFLTSTFLSAVKYCQKASLE